MTLARSSSSNEAPIFVRKKKKHAPIFSSRPKRIWLVSFTDFMSLMVAFFVMIYSMGDPVLTKFKPLSESLGDSFSSVKLMDQRSFAGPRGQMGDSDVISLGRVRYKAGKDVKYMAEVLDIKRQNIPELEHLSTALEGDVFTVSLPLADLLDMNRDLPTRASQVVARELATLLAGTNNKMELVVDFAGGTQNNIMRAMDRGQAVRLALASAGLTNDISVLVNGGASVTTPDAPLEIHLRITRFR